MNKEILKNNKVLLESYNNFRRLVEYTSMGTVPMTEDDEEMNQEPTPDMQDGGMDPSMGGNAPQDQMMGGNQPMGGDPSMMGGGPNMEQGGDPSMTGGDMMGGDPNMQGAEAQGFNPQGSEEQLGATPETDPNQEEEEVIDVDDLTNSQEETEAKVDSLSDKFERLFGMIDAFEKQIDASNERMESLRAEIEKRNPTPVEKMSLRAANSYPFNVSPNDYWKDKEATSNYTPDDDKNGVNDPQYQITKDDIDNIADYNQIAKSLDADYMSLKDLLDF